MLNSLRSRLSNSLSRKGVAQKGRESAGGDGDAGYTPPPAVEPEVIPSPLVAIWPPAAEPDVTDRPAKGDESAVGAVSKETGGGLDLEAPVIRATVENGNCAVEASFDSADAPPRSQVTSLANLMMQSSDQVANEEKECLADMSTDASDTRGSVETEYVKRSRSQLELDKALGTFVGETQAGAGVVPLERTVSNASTELLGDAAADSPRSADGEVIARDAVVTLLDVAGDWTYLYAALGFEGRGHKLHNKFVVVMFLVAFVGTVLGAWAALTSLCRVHGVKSVCCGCTLPRLSHLLILIHHVPVFVLVTFCDNTFAEGPTMEGTFDICTSMVALVNALATTNTGCCFEVAGDDDDVDDDKVEMSTSMVHGEGNVNDKETEATSDYKAMAGAGKAVGAGINRGIWV